MKRLRENIKDWKNHIKQEEFDAINFSHREDLWKFNVYFKDNQL